MHYGLNGKIIAQKGERDKLAEILLQAAEALQSNPDCVHYVVSLVEDEPNVIWVSEVWNSEAAHNKSLEPEEIQTLIQEARPLIEGFGEQVRLKSLGGKGL